MREVLPESLLLNLGLFIGNNFNGSVRVSKLLFMFWHLSPKLTKTLTGISCSAGIFWNIGTAINPAMKLSQES